MQSMQDELELLGFQRARAEQAGDQPRAEALKAQMSYTVLQIQQAREARHRATAPTQKHQPQHE